MWSVSLIALWHQHHLPNDTFSGDTFETCLGSVIHCQFGGVTLIRHCYTRLFLHKKKLQASEGHQPTYVVLRGRGTIRASMTRVTRCSPVDRCFFVCLRLTSSRETLWIMSSSRKYEAIASCPCACGLSRLRVCNEF